MDYCLNTVIPCWKRVLLTESGDSVMVSHGQYPVENDAAYLGLSSEECG
jgi:hypothetical protein